MLPLHDHVQRQFPLPEHRVLLQHLISLGVPGQALEMNVPPEEEHLDVVTQTPGAFSLPVQGPFKIARSEIALLYTMVALEIAVAMKK